MHIDLSLFPFGGVFVVEPNLSENSDIYHNLQASANDELRWSFTQVKISGFEDVPASPHEHHLQAEKPKLKKDVGNSLNVEISQVLSNPLDSRKTKLLKTKTVDFFINNKQFSSNYFKKSQNNDIIFIEKSKK